MHSSCETEGIGVDSAIDWGVIRRRDTASMYAKSGRWDELLGEMKSRLLMWVDFVLQVNVAEEVASEVGYE